MIELKKPTVRIQFNNGPKMTKLKDIAAATGVSVETVSRILNGKSKERWPNMIKKAERIREAARQLNYTPNRAARMMRTKRTHQIGVLVSELYNPNTGRRVEALTDALDKRGYTLVLGMNRENQPDTAAKLRAFGQNMLDGILVLDPVTEAEDLSRLVPNVPVMLFNRSPQQSPAVIDLRASAQLALEHLWSLGHRRIALITGPDRNDYLSNRLGGYESFYAGKTEAASPDWIIRTTWKHEDGHAAVDHFLKTGCTACVAGNDLLAVGLCSGLRERGYEVPRDYSLVSIDDTLLTRINSPALTSVPEPLERLITITVDALIAKIEGQEPAACEILSPELIIRQSTRPLKI